MKKLAMGLVPLLLSGCFTYVPVDLGVLPVGGSVRVQVEERRDATFRPPSGSARLSGILVRESPTEVVLRVPLAPGSEFGQEFTIPISAIMRVEPGSWTASDRSLWGPVRSGPQQRSSRSSPAREEGYPRGTGQTQIRASHSPGDLVAP